MGAGAAFAGQLAQDSWVRVVKLVPDDPQAVIEQLAAPSTRIVTLTITEGGYNLEPATGKFDDAIHALLDEPGTPPPHRIRVHLTSPADLVVGDTLGRPQQCTRLHHLPVQQRRRHRHPPQLDPLFIRHQQRRSNHDRILPKNHVNLQAHH